MILVAVATPLWEMVAERISPAGTYAGATVTLVDRPPARIALDCAAPLLPYAVAGDVALLTGSDPGLVALAEAAAPQYDCRLRVAATEVDAPLARAVADGGGLGLAVVGRHLEDDDVFAGANALAALLGGVLSRL